MNNKIIIGMDGGGTKTAAVAMDMQGNIISTSLSGGINYNFMPMSDAVDNVVEAVKLLGLPSDASLIISIGHPSLDDGFNSPAEQEFISLLKERIDAEIIMKSDVYMALYALTGGKPGLMVIGGTGSIGVGIDHDGIVHTVGGWGFPTNDDGSAYSIAVGGLHAVFDESDGFGEKTMLTDAAVAFYNVSRPRELIDVLNGNGLTKTEVAKFAVKVTECAKNGDIIAENILKNAGHYLALYAKSLIRIIGTPIEKVGMTGGVLKNGDIVRESFMSELREEYGDITIEFPSVAPEIGAAKYAMGLM